MYLQANYHTHTVRCHHASGTEREYIEKAISCGMKTLGFSDHSPYLFDGDYYSGFRVRLSDVDDYFDTLTALKKEYAGTIDIHIGFEAEYYPKLFGRLIGFLKDYPVEYLIMGQHFLGNEIDAPYCPRPTEDEKLLETFVNQTTEGLETGKYTYFAHPDVLNWVGDEKTYRKHITPLCENAKRLGIPLEFNFLGFVEHRHYPRELFFRIAGEVGNDVIFGCDAHSPDAIYRQKLYEDALVYLDRFGIVPVPSVTLRCPV